MKLLRAIVGRVRDDQAAAIRAELAELREIVLAINHRVTTVHDTVMALNHDVRAGAESSLPLFIGHTEQLRTDAETAVAAAQVIERQLSMLEDRIATLTAAPDAAG